MVTPEISHFSYSTFTTVLKFWIQLHRNSIFFSQKIQHKPFWFFPYLHTNRTDSINTPAAPKGQSENHKQHLHYLPNQTLNYCVSCLSSLSSLLVLIMLNVTCIYASKFNGLVEATSTLANLPHHPRTMDVPRDSCSYYFHLNTTKSTKLKGVTLLLVKICKPAC